VNNMKKHIVFSLISILLLGLASCDNTSSITYSSDSLGGWDDPWDVSWPDEDESESTNSSDTCLHRCLVCGKCLDDECDEAYEGERCSDLNGRTSYEFNAISGKVLLGEGSLGSLAVVDSDNYIGNFNHNVGSSINYVINAPEESDSCLQVTLSMMPDEENVTSCCVVKVNGEQQSSYGTLSADPNGESWVNFSTVTLGCVTLNKGQNTISLGVENDTAQQFNVRSISLISPNVLTQLDANDPDADAVCNHQDADGYCTDYDSNDLCCLNKREDGWTVTNINGEDDRVIKKSDTRDDLWNDDPSEQCIGYISSDTDKARIAWAFTISEDCYVRFSLENSTCGKYSKFTDVWNMTLNGEEMITDGRTSNTSQSFWTYEMSKVGYFKATAGFNLFEMEHMVSFGYNIRSLEISIQKGTLEISQAEMN